VKKGMATQMLQGGILITRLPVRLRKRVSRDDEDRGMRGGKQEREVEVKKIRSLAKAWGKGTPKFKAEAIGPNRKRLKDLGEPSNNYRCVMG